VVIRQLAYLVALARERHFGRAAAACNVTQPTLSAGIRHLEHELGVPLVERSQRFQGLTPEGERVLTWAQRILADCDSMVQDLGTAKTGLAGRLRIGVIPTALAAVGVLARPFLDRHPAVQIGIRSMSSIEIQDGLDRFEIDLGITYLDNEPLANVRAQALYRERYVLLAGADVPLAGRDRIGWAEAAAIPLALLTPNMQNRRIVDAAFRRVQCEPQAEFEADALLALVAHVRAGQRASVLPQALLNVIGVPEGCRALPLVEPEVSHTVGLVVADREPTPPLAKAFLALVNPGTLQTFEGSSPR
jgi:DNA-binding transcriptional LysR family regulator